MGALELSRDIDRLNTPLLPDAFSALVDSLAEDRLEGLAGTSPISVAVAIVDGIGRAALELASRKTCLSMLSDRWPYLLARIQWLYSSVVATAQHPLELDRIVIYDAAVLVLGRTIFSYTLVSGLAIMHVANAEVVGLLTRLHLATRRQAFLSHDVEGTPYAALALTQVVHVHGHCAYQYGRPFGPHALFTSIAESSGGHAASEFTRLLRVAARRSAEMHPRCLPQFFEMVMLLGTEEGGSVHALWTEVLQNRGIASLTRAAALNSSALAKHIPGYFSTLHSVPLTTCYSTALEAVNNGLFRVYIDAARAAGSSTLLSVDAGLVLSEGCLAASLVYHSALDQIRTAFDKQVSLDSSARLGASEIGSNWADFERLLVQSQIIRYQFRQDRTPRVVCDIVRVCLVLGKWV